MPADAGHHPEVGVANAVGEAEPAAGVEVERVGERVDQPGQGFEREVGSLDVGSDLLAAEGFGLEVERVGDETDLEVDGHRDLVGPGQPVRVLGAELVAEVAADLDLAHVEGGQQPGLDGDPAGAADRLLVAGRQRDRQGEAEQEVVVEAAAAQEQDLGDQAQVADPARRVEHDGAGIVLVARVDHLQRQVDAELAPAEEADGAEQVERGGGVERAGDDLVVSAVALDHRIVGDVEEQAEPPAEVERRLRVLGRERALGADRRLEALAVEAVGLRGQAAGEHQRDDCCAQSAPPVRHGAPSVPEVAAAFSARRTKNHRCR
jgi:hypothetical protein